MTQHDELTLRLALTRLSRIRPQHQRTLYEEFGSATKIYDSIASIETHFPDATPRLREELSMIDAYIAWARDEISYCHDHGIDILCHDDSRFPMLLNHCEDAPTVLYSVGHADYNSKHIVSSVGTRRCTEYGKDVCRHLFKEIASLLPDCLVVSGLAYGIDIESHRAALAAGLPTVAVVAHGLDDLYPAPHRTTANEMIKNGGGLLSEYPHGTRIDKRNFVERNRIVAGMSHATIVIESAAKGGSLITADMASGYNREVFACPGRIGDTYSQGCNKIIANNIANILTSSEELLQIMGWENAGQPVQGELFPSLTPEEEAVHAVLTRHEEADAPIISAETGMTIRHVTTLLSTMEMDGKVRAVPGSSAFRWNF